MAEVFAPVGDIREVELNIEAAVRSGFANYGVVSEDLDKAALWMLGDAPGSRSYGDRAAIYGAVNIAGHRSLRLQSWLAAQPAEPALSIFLLTQQLEGLLQLADLALSHYRKA